MECTQHSSMLLQILTSGQVRIAHLEKRVPLIRPKLAELPVLL